MIKPLIKRGDQSIDNTGGRMNDKNEEISGNLKKTKRLTDQEKQKILVEWNETERALPPTVCVHHLFEMQAKKNPNAIAVHEGAKVWTYKDLNERSNQLAHSLARNGVKTGKLVALVLERSFNLILCELAILKVGAAYVPLDPGLPTERISSILSETQAELILTTQQLRNKLPEIWQSSFCIDRDWDFISIESRENPDPRGSQDDMAYMIFTSGSTGKPKGVPIHHRGLLNLSLWHQDYYHLTQEDRGTLIANPAFDASIWEIWPYLISGSSMCIPDEETRVIVERLVAWLISEKITITFLPTPIAQLMLECEWPEKAALRYLLTGGDALRMPKNRVWPFKLMNHYGPTENTVVTTFCEIDPDASGKPSIGRPIYNTKIYILDEYMNPVPPGEPGELYIQGVGVSHGYWNATKVTQKNFVNNPFSKTKETLYKTGDLARYMPDGNVDFLGRIDHQVKIRGYRIELGEIEIKLKENSQIRDALVLAKERENKSKYLVAYVISEKREELNEKELKGYLKDLLPDYMVPSYFLFLDEFPLTRNEKIDQKALPEPDIITKGDETPSEVLKSPLQNELRTIWKNLLGLEVIHLEDDFFELGGDSLLATQLLSRIRAEFKTELLMTDIFDHSTLKKLSIRIEESQQDQKSLIIPPILSIAEREQSYPLSFSQQRLWFLQQMTPESSHYNIPFAIVLRGTLNEDLLEKSFNAILERHESLRTALRVVEGKAIQVIETDAQLTLHVTSLEGVPEEERDSIIDREAKEEAQKIFDLSSPPLIRARLLRFDAEFHALLLVMHHAVSDGWSMGIFVNELSELYQSYLETRDPNLVELPIQYVDYVVWQRYWMRGEVLEKQLAFWKNKLHCCSTVMNIPTDHIRPDEQTFRGAQISFFWDDLLLKQIQKLNRKNGTTLFMTLLSTFAVMLFRYTGEEDLVIGTPIANRNHSEIENLIGFFVNTLPLRCQISERLSFSELLNQIREDALEAFNHQDVPYEKIIESLQLERNLSYQPLCQVAFALQNIPIAELDLPGLTIVPKSVDGGTARFDLTLIMEEKDGGLSGLFEYNTDLFEEETVRELITHLEVLMRTAIINPEKLLKEFPVTVNEKERHLLVQQTKTLPQWEKEEFGQAFVAPTNEIEKKLVEIWEEVLAVNPIGIHDNFFELGGDSILSIQIISLANRNGIRLIPKHLFQYQTICELAKIAGEEKNMTKDFEFPKDEIAQTPMLRWFLNWDWKNSNLFSQYVELKLKSSIRSDILKESLQLILEHHDALRMSVHYEEGKRKLQLLPAEGLLRLTEVDLSNLSEEEQKKKIEDSWDQWNQIIEPEKGVNSHIILVQTNTTPILYWIAHHLVVDGVSWGILLKELQTCYQNLSTGNKAQMPEKTTSFAEWSHRLVGLIDNGNFEKERIFWSTTLSSGETAIPKKKNGENRVNSSYLLTANLTPQETDQLLRELPKKVKIQPNELLLTALASTLSVWTGRESTLIDHEHHGREDLFETVNLSETVGWFTNVHPVLLTWKENDELSNNLEANIDFFRSVPNHGIGFGLLPPKKSDKSVKLREIAFNYLGNPDRITANQDTLFNISNIGLYQGEENKRIWPLEINCLTLRGSMRIQWIFSENLHDLDEMRLLLEHYSQMVRSLLSYCLEDGPNQHFSFQYPLTGLNSRELNRVIGGDQEVETIYPLSHLQKGLLYHYVKAPDQEEYSEQFFMSFKEKMNSAHFEKAWERVIQRHEGLRATYHWQGLDQPLQIIHKQIPLDWKNLNWKEYSDEEIEKKLEALLKEDRDNHFDLTSEPAYRFYFIDLPNDRCYFIWSFHHILLDGWSCSILFQDLYTIYHAIDRHQKDDLKPARQFREYIAWLQKQDMTQSELFWRDQLKGFSAMTDIRMGKAAQEKSSFQDFRITLTKRETGKLEQFVRSNQLALNTLIQGAWSMLLSRYSGENDVVHGMGGSGRPTDLSGVEEVVGLLVNTMPLRVKIDPEQSVGLWLEDLQQQMAEIRHHQAVPLVDIQHWSEVPVGSPLFETMLGFENYPTESLLHPYGIPLDELRSFDRTHYPLTLLIIPDEELVLTLVYDQNRFDQVMVQRILKHFQNILQQMTEDAERELGELSLLDQEERHEILVTWNQTKTNYPSKVTVQALFEKQVEKNPNAVALKFEEQTMTYRELNIQANQLAHQLRILGVKTESSVGLCVKRSFRMYIGILGIIKAGGVYVPLDADYPEDRLRFMIEDTNISILLTQRSLQARLPAFEGKTILLDKNEEVSDYGKENPVNKTEPDNLIYIIYTSGSTGRPKGVSIPHRAVVRLVKNTNYADFTSDEVFLQLASISFDASTFELWGALLNGATLVIYPAELPTLERLGEVIKEQGVTILFITSGLFQQMMENNPEGLGTLRQLITGGEILSPPHIHLMANKFKNCKMICAYGPTENTSYSTTHLMPPGCESNLPIPIGKPISNTTTFIVDQCLQPVPVGVVGELLVGGDGLAREYHNRPDLTAERFIENPFDNDPDSRLYRTGDLVRYASDGTIEILGRIDNQVKISGFRIELGEIQVTLYEHPDVRDVQVTIYQGIQGEKRLIAYIIPVINKEDQEKQEKRDEESNDYWQVIYQELYQEGEEEKKDPFMNTTGWMSSYTGKPIDDVAMREWVDETVNRIRQENPKRVLELGCGTGLLLSRIAPHCEEYLGTDFSKNVIDSLQKLLPKEWPVTLEHRNAEDFDGIKSGYYDTIIMNSVSQYLPGIHTLRNILLQAVEAVENGGTIFIGDIRYFSLLQRFHLSVQLHKADDEMTISNLMEKVEKQCKKDKELLIDPGFFHSLQVENPRISEVKIQWKRGEETSEMLRFRYDVILKIGTPKREIRKQAHEIFWRESMLSYEKLVTLLEQEAPEGLVLRNVPNGRLWRENLAMKLINKDNSPETVKELKEKLEEASDNVVPSPMKFWNIPEYHPYTVTLHLRTKKRGSFDLFLGRKGTDFENKIPSFFYRERNILQDWKEYANNPAEQFEQQQLLESLRSFLQSKLPQYMIPSTFVFMDRFPLMPNGKVDRKVLPAPEQRDILSSGYVPPRTEAEKIMTKIWVETLQIEPIGANDNFFDLGGHSLRAIQLISKVASIMGVEISVKQLHECPTIRELTRKINEVALLSQQEDKEVQEREIAAPNISEHTTYHSCDSLASLVEQRPQKVKSVAFGTLPDSIFQRTGINQEEMISKGFDGEPQLFSIMKTLLGNIGLILLPCFDCELYSNREKAMKLLIQGMELAGRLGADTVSLTGLIPSGTEYGKALKEAIAERNDLPRVTTGHTTTVASVVLSIQNALEQGGRKIEEEKVSFLGLGSIGISTLHLMLECLPHPKKLVLCDIYSREEDLNKLAKEVQDRYNYQGELKVALSGQNVPQEVYDSRLIVGATNVPDILEVGKLLPGSIIVDDSGPHCFSPGAAIRRFKEKQDILFTEGGVLHCPEVIPREIYWPKVLEKAVELSQVKGFMEAKPHNITGCILSGIFSACYDDLVPLVGIIEPGEFRPHFDKLVELGFRAANLHCHEYWLEEALIEEFRKRYGN